MTTASAPSRSRALPASLSILALACAFATPVFAQDQNPALSVHALKGGAYWVSGGISNTGFVVGNTGVLAIDAQRSTAGAQQELYAIAKVSLKPVKQIVLTHADPDHVGGLPAFPAGATISAQENVKTIIEASIADLNGGPVNGPLYAALANHLPTNSVGDFQQKVVDGIPMVLIHVAPAHTAADLMVYLPAHKVVYAGDILVNNAAFPVIHTGGSSLGWIATMKTLLELNADTYVPGHGAIESKDKLRARLRDAEQRRAAVKAMVEQNKTLEEVLQALPDTGVDPRFPTFTKTVFLELTRGYPPSEAVWIGLQH